MGIIIVQVSKQNLILGAIDVLSQILIVWNRTSGFVTFSSLK